MVGVGVIGAGYWGPNLIRNFAAADDCTLTAVCDQSQERLAAIGVPSDAYDDSVVLMLTRPFDSLLWDVIRETLAKRGLTLDEVTEIDGAYVERDGGVFLRLDAAIAKTDQRRVPLGRRLRISL